MEASNDKIYFAVSDVHSFYTAMKEALDEAGYDPENERHVLIAVGDLFDRGDETLKVLKFIQSIPKERRVLIRGNHELLLKQCYESKQFYVADETNGTAKTMCHLCRFDYDFRRKMAKKIAIMDLDEWQKESDRKWGEYLSKPFRSKKVKEVVDWIDSDEWVNYFELGKFVFVHSWVPLKTYYTDDFHEKRKVDPNWRSASEKAWDAAMWGCPWRLYLDGLVPDGKTIVCGHWHVQDFHTHLGHDAEGFRNRDIYFSDRLIALDACTAKEPHVCNVLVIDGGKCYDKHRKALN